MGYVRDVVGKAESMIGKIPYGYQLRMSQMLELRKKSPDWSHLVENSFRFGYLQGMKATKAEMKKKKTV